MRTGVVVVWTGGGSTVWLAVGLFAVAAALMTPGRPAPGRLARPHERAWRRFVPRTGRTRTRRERGLHRLAAATSAGGLLLVFGLPWGLVLGAVAVVLVPILLRRFEPGADRRRAERIVSDLPMVVDLLAACLRAGRPVDDAVATVSVGVGGPLGESLTEVGRSLRLGADPVDAWGCLLAEPACAGFARAMHRALRSGAPLASTLEHLADDVREDRRWSAEERARAVETRSVVPLGLCFLPAFILLGVVPTVAGSLSGVLSQVGG